MIPAGHLLHISCPLRGIHSQFDQPLLGDALLGVADTFAATGAFAAAETALKRAEQAEPANPRLTAARERILSAARAKR